MHTVVEMPTFLRQAERHGMSEEEREEFVGYIAANPDAGDLIKGSGGCRKVRFAGKGKGKSGAFRMITFFASQNMPVFLLTMYAKDRLKTLTDVQVNAMKQMVKAIANEYEGKEGR